MEEDTIMIEAFWKRINWAEENLGDRGSFLIVLLAQIVATAALMLELRSPLLIGLAIGF